MGTGGEGRKLQRTGDDDAAAVAVEGLRPWADLHPDLLLRVPIAGNLSLADFPSLRTVCSPWRSAVPPVSPLFLYTASYAGGGPQFAATFSIPWQRSLELSILLDVILAGGSKCVGSSNGWLAVEEILHFWLERKWRLILLNLMSGKKIHLPSWRDEQERVRKMVFAPNPRDADFTAVAICRYNTLAYAKSGTRWWKEVVLPDEMVRNTLTDVLYHEDGKIYCIDESGNVGIIRLPDGRGHGTARVENLLLSGDNPLDADSAFLLAPQFSTFYRYTNVKNLVFWEGNLYQVWRISICTRTSAPLPDGSQCRVLQNEIFVLRYDPGSTPCWSEVRDLRGYSVFVGKNNAVAVRAGGVPGVRANCVYWIGGWERDQAMVFDMATRISTPCVQAGGTELYLQRAICWYFAD